MSEDDLFTGSVFYTSNVWPCPPISKLPIFTTEQKKELDFKHGTLEKPRLLSEIARRGFQSVTSAMLKVVAELKDLHWEYSTHLASKEQQDEAVKTWFILIFAAVGVILTCFGACCCCRGCCREGKSYKAGNNPQRATPRPPTPR